MQYYVILVIKNGNKFYTELSNKDHKYYFPCCKLNNKIKDKNFIPTELNLNFLKPEFNSSYPYEDIVVNDTTFTILQIELNYDPEKLRDNIPYLWVPEYYLNKNYFDNTSKLFINLYNSYYPVDDIPLEARILFSKAYFNKQIDMYDYIIKFTDYCLKNKQLLDIYSSEEFIKLLTQDRCYDKFYKANKEICQQAAKMYYEYHDKDIKEI